MRLRLLKRSLALKRTVLSMALASACAGAWAMPEFTLTPGAVGLTGSPVSGDNIVLSDFLTATFTGSGTTFTERGYLSVASFQLGGSNVVAGGLNSTYSLYFDFNATGHLTSANTDPLAGMTSGVFDTLTYSLVGANGNSTFSTAGNNPPRKMTICHNRPIRVPSWMRRIRRAVSSLGAGEALAAPVASSTLT